MKLVLYALPCAGKSHILNELHSNKIINVIEGSELLYEIEPNFKLLSENDKKKIRVQLINRLKTKDNFIMTGHYAFNDTVVFTNEDGQLYDVFFYLYQSQKLLYERMQESEKNSKYIKDKTIDDIKKWQEFELKSLREYCRNNDKDFYIIDYAKTFELTDTTQPINFIKDVITGFSSVNFARKQVDEILKTYQNNEIILCDGDKTLIKQDSSSLINYKTDIFNGNFYSGYQQWLQYKEFQYYKLTKEKATMLEYATITLQDEVYSLFNKNSQVVILTAGNCFIWQNIVKQKNLDYMLITGNQVSADTKYFICKFLQEKGKIIIAFGDSRNDYDMICQADYGYFITKNGKYSKSLQPQEIDYIINNRRKINV